MHRTTRVVIRLLVIATLMFPVTATAKKGKKVRQSEIESASQENAVLWRNPADIRSRNLFFGRGGKEHAPHSVFTFIKEDLNGTNPKFDVRDEDGVKWRIKLGAEARPETVATRLVWAVGYSANEDYLVPELRVENMPAHLHRGQSLIGPEGTIYNARLKRFLKEEKKTGRWRWRYNPFTGTRELNGLRVMMALLNNWDLKDENNSVYEDRRPQSSQGPEHVYMVSDLGASLGTTGRSWTQAISKGNLKSFSHSKFIVKVTDDYVDFNIPTRSALVDVFDLPDFIGQLRLRWIGKRIPRADARWVGQLLAQLSPDQIRDAFLAAGYTPREVEGFIRVVEERIAELSGL